MSLTKNLPMYAVLAVLAAGAGLWLWRAAKPEQAVRQPSAAVVVPALSPMAMEGQSAFNAVCAACHGVNAAGTDKGPPLVHPIYNPGHHADIAFLRAVRLGARQHHWPYGDMPPQQQVTDEQVAEIVQYIRELQEANGITNQPHMM